MNTLTFMQAVELIDIAANENRLYHHNGGQAYIKVSHESNVLMIIDHTISTRIPEITLCDGTEYFTQCMGYNLEHSKRLREHETSMVEWFSKHFNDIIALEKI